MGKRKRLRFTSPDSITIIGNLPDDPDLVPFAPPCGFIWITGGTWGGTHEEYGIANARISVDGTTLDFAMTRDDAVALRGLLDEVIDAMGCHDYAVEKED